MKILIGRYQLKCYQVNYGHGQAYTLIKIGYKIGIKQLTMNY